MNVFLLEDEAFVAMDMEDLLRSAGHEVVGPALSLEQARALLAEHTVDFAIVDANIRGDAPVDVVETLIARNIPYVYISGYAKADLEGRLPDGPFIPKPVRYEILQDYLNDA